MNDEIEAIAALADPVRRRLYDLVVAEGRPISREQAAAGAAVPLHSVRFHLDRLVEEGLLEVEYRRLTGRSGPGAGRPAKLYRRSAREVAVSLPQRNYDLVGSILAAAVERTLEGGEMAAALRQEARARGREVGTAYAEAAGAELERAATALAGEGFEPTLADDEVCLRNCPFDSLARAHTQLVCGVNLRFVGGVVEGLGCSGLEARLDPAEDRCCVVVAAH
jgi:predicted ArsR family transcriptional regulator